MSSHKNNISKGLFWKLLENFGVSGIQFILQIILARLLDPEHYGVLAIMIIFTSLANVFINTGFSTSLIQNKNVTEEDYSSVFWVTMLLAGLSYVVIFMAAPWIAVFYNMPALVRPLRVLALMLLPGALNSVQRAKVSREMNFKKVFYSSVAGILISGIVSIVLAYMGVGLWALVAQRLMNTVINCIVMRFTVGLKLHFVCNLRRVKVLFGFGWKLLVSALLDTLYSNLQSLVIGKKYDSATLAYNDKGKHYPQFVINIVNSSVQSVMLPAMSAQQDKREKVKTMMRNSITMSAYIIFPMMAGLAAVATPLVTWMLTEKWLPCVPYLQIYCFTQAFYPVHSCNLQGINAMGRSDIFLKLEIIKKSYGIAALAIAVFCFDSPIAIAATGLVTTWISWFVNSYPNKKLLGYSYIEQIRDLIPPFVMSGFMCATVLFLGTLIRNPLVSLVIQVIAGMATYLVLSLIIRPTPFLHLLEQLKKTLHKAG